MKFIEELLSSPHMKNFSDCISYTSLVVTAAYCVYEGCKRSVAYLNNQKQDDQKAEVLSTREVAIFPIMASATLLSAYLIFRLFSKEYTNILLDVYFFIVGQFAVFRTYRSLFSYILPNLSPLLPNTEYTLSLTAKSDESKDQDRKDEVINKWVFNSKDILALIICNIFGIWNFLYKHWLANNIIAIAISINAIEMMHLNKYSNGVILLCGLFLYDIFWVFGTDVMVSVAKNIEGPIKVVMPTNVFNVTAWQGRSKDISFSMLGLGDIVIPGIFMALLKRFDDLRNDETEQNHKSQASYYHKISLIFYIIALLCTVIVMKIFKHAQPALLYIVPLLIIPVTVFALFKGDINTLLSYRDDIEGEDDTKKKSE